MRAIRISSLLLVSVLALSACQMRVEQRFEVNEDGSGSIRVVTLFDEEAQELVTFGMGFEAIVQDAPEGFAVEVVEEGDLAGTAMSAEFADLSAIPLITRELAEEGGMGTVNVRQTGDAFVFQMSLPDEGLSVEGNELADFGDLSDFEGFGEIEDIIQYKIVAVLPGHIVDSNADDVSGDTAEWTLSMLSPPTEMLYATSQPGGGGSFPIWLILAGIVAVALIALIIASWRREPTVSAGVTGEVAAPEPAGAIDQDPASPVAGPHPNDG